MACGLRRGRRGRAAGAGLRSVGAAEYGFGDDGEHVRAGDAVGGQPQRISRECERDGERAAVRSDEHAGVAFHGASAREPGSNVYGVGAVVAGDGEDHVPGDERVAGAHDGDDAAGGGGAGLHADAGAVFKITPSGALTTLHSFDGTDGAYLTAGLVQASDGNFYGTTSSGGANQYYGTVFKITPSGTLTVLHSFDGADGNYPSSVLLQATDGNFYGTTIYGGTFNDGTIFKITPDGTLTVLHSFNGADGEYPYGGLMQATDGSFYGTTSNGGAYENYGTVFSLSVGLAPFVETNPGAGKVGAKIFILGSDLTGATSVTFNGAPAVFTLVSKTFIRATVPSGATTGIVQVTAPGGTLSSNVVFRVLP